MIAVPPILMGQPLDEDDQPAERAVTARSGTSRMRSTLRSVWEVQALSPDQHFGPADDGRPA